MLSLNCSVLRQLITNSGVLQLCIMLQGNIAGNLRQERAVGTYCHEGYSAATDLRAVVHLALHINYITISSRRSQWPRAV